MEGVRIRVDSRLQLESIWEGTEFMICSRCKQVVRKEDIEKKIHVCWSPKELISVIIPS